MDKDYIIKKAEYFVDYKLMISFSDGVSQIFDFKNLVTSDQEAYKQYLDVTKFKKFKIHRKTNTIAWGKENRMQMPAYILYSEKRASKGWTKYESFAELKKRLHRKFYYEMFVDNAVWGGIGAILCLLQDDKNSKLFSKKFHNGTDERKYLFEISTRNFHISIKLHPFGLVYNHSIKAIGSSSYEVNFKNAVDGRDSEGKDLENYEVLFHRVCKLIKKNRNNLITKFEVIK